MFKKLIATALLAASAFTAAPATASIHSEFGYTNQGQQILERTLELSGVTTTTGNCADYDIHNTYGFFMPAKKWIHICTDVATTHAEVWETYRHEAIHAAQHCKDSSMGSTLATKKWLFKNGYQSDWDFITEAYDQDDHMIELEAFTLMRESNMTVAKIVAKHCDW